LARQWQEATLLTSSITDMATHSAYQQIIGMGEAALPWIFAELLRCPDTRTKGDNHETTSPN